MNTRLFLTTCLIALATMTTLSAQDAPKAEAGNVITDGMELGKFTQDYDAALAFAKEKKMPVLLVFTGSDWCGWCKIMDKNVFSKPEWTAYSKDNLVMIWLDYPRDKSKVPQKYQKRNDGLKATFGIRGFPTYVVQDWDGRKLGQLGSGKDKTPASFQAEVEEALKGSATNIEKLCATYKPEDAKQIRSTMGKMQKIQATRDESMKKVAELRAQADKLQKESDTQFRAANEAFNKAMEQGKVGVMSPEALAKYKAAKAEVSEAKKVLADWLQANRRKRPTPELNQKYGKLNKAVADAQKVVDGF
jgi:thioredoxin-related protein